MLSLGLVALVGCQPTPQGTFRFRTLETATDQSNRSLDAPLFESSDDPQTIVDKAIQAYGGPDKCRRWRCGRIKFSASVKGIDGEFEETFELPGKFKRVVWAREGTELKPVLSFAINGDEGWSRMTDGSIQPLVQGPEAKVEEHRLAMIFNPLHLRDDECNLTILGEEKVENCQTVAIRVESDIQSRTVFIGKSDGLIRKVVAKLPKTVLSNEGLGETFFRAIAS